jgi:hypothetical protein
MSYRRPFRALLPFAAAIVLAAPAAFAQVNFTAQLFGQALVPPVETDAYGSCLGVLDAAETTFTLSCEHTLDEPVAAGIEIGFGGETGPEVFDLGGGASPIQAVWDLSPEEAVLLLAGSLYVEIDSAGHPGGELRGPLLPAQPLAGHVLTVPLSGAQEVPPVAAGTRGACQVGLEYEGSPFIQIPLVTLRVRCAHDVGDATGAELVLAPRGQEGTVTVDLGDGDSPIDTTVELTAASQVNAVFAGNWYVDVLSASHPGGEIRGQLDGCIGNAETLCLDDGRFAVSLRWNLETDVGDAVAVRETGDSGMFWFFRPSNLEALVKVLDGCGANGHYWVFVAATTNVGYELKVVDTLFEETVTYSNTRGDVAQPRLDTAAFDNCP